MRRATAILAIVFSLATAAPALATLVLEPGGGQWNYGASLEGLWGKVVWSNYYYPSHYHHSTAVCSSSNQTGGAAAGSWSYATVHCNAWDTGYVSFSND